MTKYSYLKNQTKIRVGTFNDIDELEILYDELNTFFQVGVNFPGWLKGIYPIRETATVAIEDGTLFVLEFDQKIVGSILLNHHEEEAYKQVTWGIKAAEHEVLVVHTLVVHPNYMSRGLGQRLMEFAMEYGVQKRVKTIRLDVAIQNIPAIILYEKSGYRYVETVDLGLGYEHLVWFKLYELNF